MNSLENTAVSASARSLNSGVNTMGKNIRVILSFPSYYESSAATAAGIRFDADGKIFVITPEGKEVATQEVDYEIVSIRVYKYTGTVTPDENGYMKYTDFDDNIEFLAQADQAGVAVQFDAPLNDTLIGMAITINRHREE